MNKIFQPNNWERGGYRASTVFQTLKYKANISKTIVYFPLKLRKQIENNFYFIITLVLESKFETILYKNYLKPQLWRKIIDGSEYFCIESVQIGRLESSFLRIVKFQHFSLIILKLNSNTNEFSFNCEHF